MRFSGLGWALCPVLFCQTIGLARAQNGAAGPEVDGTPVVAPHIVGTP